MPGNAAPPPAPDQHTFDLLRLTLTPGLGPILIARLLAACGSPGAVLAADPAALRSVRGIGPERAAAIAKGFRESAALAEAEVAAAHAAGAHLLAIGSPAYPPLLAQLPDAPPLLYVRGQIAHSAPLPPPAAPAQPPAEPLDRYTIALVGSRSCTPYGVEQAERFAGALAAAGLTIISGGARGIDTAAHRAALRAGGRTIAVLGCGLAHAYPPDNQPLFDQIADGRGAVVSELPMATHPSSENFPARNRIISGLALGVIVVEAGRGSGALITAKAAAEEHGREVFAVPGRVDSPASAGTLDLLKLGGAQLVTEPADVLAALETPARHLHGETHAARYTTSTAPDTSHLFAGSPGAPPQPEPSSPTTANKGAARTLGLTPTQRAIVAALDNPLTIDELAAVLGATPAALRADATILEIRRCVKREGSRLARA